MLWRVLRSNGGLPDEAVVCFANTGKEEEATLRFVRDCGEKWSVPIRWLEYGRVEVEFETASRNGEPFDTLTTKKSFLPNPVARFCTQELKIKLIESVCPDSQMMLGIRADEPRRAAKMPHHNLPLVRAGITKNEVISFWKVQPFDLMTNVGNCDLCFLKGAAELMSVIRDKPDRAVWWANQEQKIGGTFRSDRPSYASMLRNVQQQTTLFGSQEESIPCFCGD
jgi:3'-phosphoadenosine 5'-phosphosulfate sulfotransferase (PAPS reductase)/FAD synthetase